jgi:hypothetical protein
MDKSGQILELREYTYREGWPYHLLADLRVRGGGKPAMVAARKALTGALRACFDGEFRSGQGSSSVSIRARAGRGFDLDDPAAVLAVIEEAARNHGLALSAAPGIDAIVCARLGSGCHDRAHHRAEAWDEHLRELRAIWAPNLDGWLWSRAKAIGVADPGAVVALHFELSALETILASAVVRRTGNYENAIYILSEMLGGVDRAAVNGAAAALEAKGFIRDLKPDPNGALFVARRGRHLARVPRDWLLAL